MDRTPDREKVIFGLRLKWRRRKEGESQRNGNHVGLTASCWIFFGLSFASTAKGVGYDYIPTYFYISLLVTLLRLSGQAQWQLTSGRSGPRTSSILPPLFRWILGSFHKSGEQIGFFPFFDPVVRELTLSSVVSGLIWYWYHTLVASACRWAATLSR